MYSHNLICYTRILFNGKEKEKLIIQDPFQKQSKLQIRILKKM